jgi:AraC-like DNA-binding protein
VRRPCRSYVSIAISSGGPQGIDVSTALDTLSEVVRSIRLRGKVYARWELTAPWGLGLPAGDFATFHLVEEGECWLATSDGHWEILASGELVVLFAGTAHVLCDRRGRAATPIERLLDRQPPGAAICRHGGGGRLTRLVCGKFSAEGLRGSGFEALPPLVRMDGSGSAGRTASLLASELASDRPGSAAIAERLSEVLVVQVLREVVDGLGARGRRIGSGWLRGIEDAHVWESLGLLHSAPGRAWTVGELARRVGLSRTVFAQRFRTLVGESPMAYLGALRHRLAETWLGEGRLSVSEVAARVGYSSASAFHRAFLRRGGGESPGNRRAPESRLTAQRRRRSPGRSRSGAGAR